MLCTVKGAILFEVTCVLIPCSSGARDVADTEDASAPRNEATTLTPTTPDLSHSSAALRMKALYGFLATLDGVLLDFACGMEHDGDSHSSFGISPSPLPPDFHVKPAGCSSWLEL